jgi:hypothetical protein
MKYFTRHWFEGDISDEESDAVWAAYRTRRDAILPLMPPTVKELATSINIHDGIVERIILNHDSESLQCDLICGDLQRGYFRLELMYGGVKVDPLELAAIARESAIEALYDEIDVLSNGLYEHRILFTHSREISIEFRTLQLTRLARAGRTPASISQRFTEK